MTVDPDAPTGTAFSPSQLAERMLHRRAVQAVVWGMPAVNYHLMYQAAEQAGAGFNQIIYWPQLLDWRNQTLTPNPDVIYLMPFTTTKDVGPVVLEIPPAEGGAINGSVMNYWQAAIEDVGPAGVDQGAGGRYLILPPGHQDPIPDGYLPLPSDTFQGFALLRSVLQGGSQAQVDQAVAYATRIRLYPLSAAADPPETRFVDASQAVFDAAIPYDLRFFQALNQMVQAEPWLERDRVMIDQLASIGIERGKAFAPDARTQKLLEDAVGEAHAWLDARYEAVFVPFNQGARWALPAAPELVKSVGSFFQLPDAYPVDARGLAYSFAFFSARHLGSGQFYLMTLWDGDGSPLDGAGIYRLTVPANAPVTQYWSATVYNRQTHTFIRDAGRLGRSSQSPGLQPNGDGSVELFFAPNPPEGQEPNWVPTNPKGGFEVLFRFYGPQQPLFDKTWQLPDLERIG